MILRRLWHGTLQVDRFIRLHQLFFTAIWLLLGAASVERTLRPAEFIALLGVILAFHVFTYVLNDVIDLPIDRTQPRRQDDPLVRGSIKPRHALFLALAQPVVAASLTWLAGGTVWAYAVLAAGMGLMGVYNLWGKRCAFPPLTDAIQGAAWASLAIYAPLAVGALINPLAWMLAAYVAVFTLLFNGVHGSLRDLRNDFVSGASTTAIFLGARPSDHEVNPRVPAALAGYATAVLFALLAIGGAMVLRNDFHYSPVTLMAIAFAVGVELLFAVALHPSVVRPHGPSWDTAWRLQLYVLLLMPATAFASHLDPAILTVLVGLNVVALTLFGCTARVARWAWSSLRGIVQRDTAAWSHP
jgi:4-hydroxybenzoate polyprenyltransferase